MEVFISHTTHDPRDYALARRLKEAVADMGGRAWIAPDEIPAGDNWEEQIVSTIMARTTDFVAVLSAAAVASEWVLKEIEMALLRHESNPAYRILILPIGLLPPYRLATQVGKFQRVPYDENVERQADQLRECLRPKESHSSTGAAVEAVADQIIAQIESGNIRSLNELETQSQALALQIRARMIGFRHFFKIGDGYAFCSWSSGGETAEYIRQFCRYTREANERVGQRFCALLGTKPMRVCISEYSRAIFSGLTERVKNQPPLEILFVRRDDRAQVPDELIAAQDYLRRLGVPPAIILSAREWLSFMEAVKAGCEHLDAVLFGAEAVTTNGDVLFPQLLPDDEVDLLYEIATRPTGHTQLVCVVEEYKFLDDTAQEEVKEISRSARYRLLPSRLWSCLVTDGGVLPKSRDGHIDIQTPRRRVLKRSRAILDALAPGGQMRPFSHMSDHYLANVEYVIADIDHTLTTKDCTIPSFVVQDFERLSQCGVQILLVTGRSAGWASALSVYLPGITAIVSENGLIITDRAGAPSLLAPESLKRLALDKLQTDSERVAAEYGLTPTNDSQFRLLERTFERPSAFGTDKLARCNNLVSQDLEVIASSIHIHVRPRGWDKADGARAALIAIASDHPARVRNIVVVGDSANDVPLFREFSEVSIGVANVCDAMGELQAHCPRFVTKARYAEGFHEVASRIFDAKTAAVIDGA